MKSIPKLGSENKCGGVVSYQAEFVFILQVLFLFISINKEKEMTKGEKYKLVPTQNERENDFFLFSHFFLVPQKGFMKAGKIFLK